MTNALTINLLLVFIAVFPQENTFINRTPHKEYQLIKHESDANFNMNALNIFMETGEIPKHLNSIKAIFEAVPGNDTYYQFMAAYQGESFTGQTKIFHDILIIKTDKSGIILDAFQYTLEWAEPPLDYDLYRSTQHAVKLKDGLDLSLLKFKNPADNRVLTENGAVIIK